MQTRALLQMVMVAVAAIVLVLVYVQWDSGAPENDAPGPSPPGPEGAVSFTSGLRYTASENGLPVYHLRAGQRLGFANNRSEFGNAVELTLLSLPQEEGAPQEITSIAGERMDLRERPGGAEEDRYDEIRIYDGVRALFAGGIELESEYLVYRNGRLSADAGVVLRIAGLIIEARRFRYNTETARGRVSGRHPDSRDQGSGDTVQIHSDDSPSAGGGPGAQLQGRAPTLEYDATNSEMSLLRSPQVDLPEATMVGNEIVLSVDPETNRVQRIEARGDRSSVLWLSAEAPGEHILRSDSITVELDETGAARVLRAVSEDGPQPRFELGEGGELRGDSIELLLGDAGDGSVVSRGTARYEPQSENEMLRSLQSGELRIDVGAAGVEQLQAADGVEVTLNTSSSETAALSGPRARFTYQNGALGSADWSSGVRYVSGDITIDAARGAYDPMTESWKLDGDPRPLMQSEEYEISADSMLVHAAGGAALVGAVGAGLRGGLIASIAPLFGGADEVGAAADMLDVGADGRLEFHGNARITQGDQLLRCDRILLLPGTHELSCSGNALVSLVNRSANRDAEDAPEVVVFLGDGLLVAGSPPELFLAGNASLDAGVRQIAGDMLTMQFSEVGDWQAINVDGAVTMVDPGGRAEGARLEYDSASGVVTVFAPPDAPATFMNSQGIDIRDPEGLRLEWADGTLSVTAMQKGTTQTVRSGG